MATNDNTALIAEFVGQTFGRITVKEFSHFVEKPWAKGGQKRFWKCSCACGRIRILREDYIKTGVMCHGCRRLECETRVEKKCGRCLRILPTSSYHRDGSTPDGLRAYCRKCSAAVALSVRLRNGRRRPEDIPTPKEKRCYACMLTKAAEEFHTSRQNPDGLVGRCSDCRSSYMRSRYVKRGRGWDIADRVGRYGLTMEEYGDLLFKQANACAICKASFGDPKDYAIDHDHTTGAVRGILCNNCNHGLGCFHDSKSDLSAAIAYLENPTAIATDTMRQSAQELVV